MYYWASKIERAEHAKRHTEDMKRQYANEIQLSVKYTTEYNPNSEFVLNREVDTPVVEFMQATSTEAIFNLKTITGKTAVLNFASYTHPGGMFLEGSSAQEESLCADSTLYNVLKEFEGSYYARNLKHKNRALYQNRALYSPSIRFFKDGETIMCDVLTCAAPNYGAADRWQNVSKIENTKALCSRMMFLKNIVESQQVDNLILGAWGTGVFKQDVEEVARLFKQVFAQTSVKRIIYAIPDSPTYNKFTNAYERD